jgi:hypothetical protein
VQVGGMEESQGHAGEDASRGAEAQPAPRGGAALWKLRATSHADAAIRPRFRHNRGARLWTGGACRGKGRITIPGPPGHR